jgi:hypothetical protein
MMIGVFVGVFVAVGVGVTDGVFVKVGVPAVGVFVTDGVFVPVGVFVTEVVFVGVGVLVTDPVAVGVGVEVETAVGGVTVLVFSSWTMIWMAVYVPGETSVPITWTRMPTRMSPTAIGVWPWRMVVVPVTVTVMMPSR